MKQHFNYMNSTRSYTGASASNINVSDIRDDWADAYQCYGKGANVAKVTDAFVGDNVQTIIGATFEDGYPNVVERQSMEQYRAAEKLRMSEQRIVAQQLEWEKHMMAQAEAINAAKKIAETKLTEEKKVYEAPKVEVKEVVDEKPTETVVEKATEVVEEVAKEPTPSLKKEDVVEIIPNEVESPKVEPKVELKVETKVEETAEKVADGAKVKVDADAAVVKEKKTETPKKEVAAKPKAAATKKTETKTNTKKTATKSTSKKSSAAKK